MAFTLRECPRCHEKKIFRTDCKTCGCGGTNPFASPKQEKNSVEKPTAQKASMTPEQIQEVQLEKVRLKHTEKKGELTFLQNRVLQLEKENEVFLEVKSTPPQVIDILPKVSSGTSESALVSVWSDWHSEEHVYPEQVSNKNEYNLDIHRQRFEKLLRGLMAWYKIAARDTKILTIVLALIGDFITGSIHEDLAEGNELPPAQAIHLVFGELISALKFLLANTPSDVTFIVPCHSGNHGRMTKEQRIATEAGNSLEYFMYLMLQDYFDGEKRIQFIVQPGYHSYVRFFEGVYEARIHHGHQINYGGGVGGITIPVNKAIGQWNKAHKVDLDVFGHFHTRFDGGNFIANGSMIGYNPYAVSIKASFEKPSQTVFLVNREYGEKTLVAPIFLD
jgi:hypothetical protein